MGEAIETRRADLPGRLSYLIGAGELENSLFRPFEDSFGPFVELSYLWAQEGAWFVASPPDLDFTAIGCGNSLAERLLAAETLDAREYPQLQTAG